MKLQRMLAVALVGVFVTAATTQGQPAVRVLALSPGGIAVPDGTIVTLAGPLAGESFAGPVILAAGFVPSLVCPADWNADDVPNSADVSAFLTGWLNSVQTGDLTADFNRDNVTNSTDISSFLSAWLAAVQGGC